MKKSNLKIILFAALFILSLSAFIFINTTDPLESPRESITNEVVDEEETPKEVILPDIEFIKRIINSGKRILPSS